MSETIKATRVVGTRGTQESVPCVRCGTPTGDQGWTQEPVQVLLDGVDSGGTEGLAMTDRHSEVTWWWGWPSQMGRAPLLRHLYLNCPGMAGHLRVHPDHKPRRGVGSIDLDRSDTCRWCARLFRVERSREDES